MASGAVDLRLCVVVVPSPFLFPIVPLVLVICPSFFRSSPVVRLPGTLLLLIVVGAGVVDACSMFLPATLRDGKA